MKSKPSLALPDRPPRPNQLTAPTRCGNRPMAAAASPFGGRGGAGLWLLLVLLLPGGLSKSFAADAEFEKLLAIASADRVRIEATLRTAVPAGDLALQGRITGAGDGAVLWSGPLQAPGATDGALRITETISGLKPVLWEPTAPALYHLEVTASRGGRLVAAKTVRFGFRSFEVRDGRFYLNGRPVFLRGLAINPPGRTIPEAVGESRAFAENYVRFLKSKNVNCFRITTDESQVWFDVCDELGMMLYAGRYGAPPGAAAGKKVAPAEYEGIIAGYQTLFEKYASHPSIVMYLLANELPVSGERGAAFSRLLTRAHEELRRWDNTRPFIGNAGYGEGREGDVCDVHRYWGWYYNSFLTYYNLRDKLRPRPLYGDPAKNQPLTFSECVGSFTSALGEFNLVRSKQLAPRLGWIGHTETPREDALRYQVFMVRQATESFRRLRPLNPRLAGLMPFTILFYHWSGIRSFDQMEPKPAMAQMGLSYQPVLLSWELWTPQVYAGTRLRPIAHVINDDDRGRALAGATLRFRLQSQSGKTCCEGEVKLPEIAYYGTWSRALPLDLPPGLATGDYVLSGEVRTADGMRSTNFCELFVAGAEWKESPPSLEQPVWLYDPAGRTAAALEKLGVAFQRLESPRPLPGQAGALVIGEGVWDETLTGHREGLRDFVRRGGRVLCLQQDPDKFDTRWLRSPVTFFSSSPNDPAYPPVSRPFREQMNINPERPAHPVFRGLNRQRLSLWSDYTAWDQTQPGFPKVYPVTTGFKLAGPDSLAHTAILADYDRGLEGVALCEMFDGEGSVILSGFDLVNRAGLDPVADRLLASLAAYTAAKGGHDLHPLIDSPIRWGEFPSERGTVCGSLNGLLVNAEWVRPPTNPSAAPMPPNTGSWNMAPGDPFLPRGRNPFGPYGYSTASSLRDPHPEAKTGTGFFWARIPESKRWVITTVENPGQTPGTLVVSLNDQPAGPPATIAPGSQVRVRSPLPAGVTTVCVRYSGEKSLVLLETAFE
ncbi:MAG TPA: glycoside hydrolase family 2 TIM barrel-domain containing protein [Candidatus Paceibacterota bacterium]|nr:glycoside hydrolase family 2 TIM barrel-domain containing protein [Candidatus Paceibacterota bacterium]